MEHPVLTAQVRSHHGKGVARKLRRENKIPAIFYGPNTEPIMLTVGFSEMERLLRQATGENVILDLEVRADQGVETRRAMLKDLQTHPVRDTFLHADFYEISMDKEITVEIPIRLINTPVGVTNGGMLQHVRREVTISCLPDRLIDSFDVDVSQLGIGDSLHLKDIALPEGIRMEDEEHLTIAVVAAPTAMPEEEVEAEELAEIEEAGAGEPREETS